MIYATRNGKQIILDLQEKIMQRKVILALVFAMGLLAAFSSNAMASYFRYGHMTWRPRTDQPDYTAEFTLIMAVKRSLYSGTGPDGLPRVGDVIQESVGGAQLDFGDSSATNVLYLEVTDINPNDDWLIGRARATPSAPSVILHTYPAATDAGGSPWVANVDTCCRLSPPTHINNPDRPYHLETTVSFAVPTASAVSTLATIVNVEQNATATFPIPATSAGGDRITWRLATEAEAGAGFIQPGPPYTATPLAVNASTGQVTWNTTGAPLGLYSAQVIIETRNTSGQVKSKAPVDFLIRITPPNRPPVINVPPTPPNGTTFMAPVGFPFSFLVEASDPDMGDTVTIGATGLPSGSAFNVGTPDNPVRGTFNWTPTAASVGSYTLTFTAQDNHGATSTPHRITVTVPLPNRPPLFDFPPTPPTLPVLRVVAGDLLTFTVQATDPDAADRVTLSVSGLPVGAAFPIPSPANPARSTFTWRPINAQAGNYVIIFNAADNRGGQAKPHRVNVRVLANRPPKFDVPPTPANGSTLTTYPGVPIAFPVQASDPDAGDVVTMSVSGLPTGATFPIPSPANPVSSAFNWTPVYEQIGQYTVRFDAVDNHGAAAPRHVINIVVANRPPVFNIPPSPDPGTVLRVYVGHLLSFTVQASDPDLGDLVTLGIATLPPGAQFNPPPPANPAQARFTWQPSGAQLGRNTLTFTATDRQGATATPLQIIVEVFSDITGGPTINLRELLAGPPVQTRFIAQSPGTGLRRIDVLEQTNVNVNVASFQIGTLDPVTITAQRVTDTNPAKVKLNAVDLGDHVTQAESFFFRLQPTAEGETITLRTTLTNGAPLLLANNAGIAEVLLFINGGALRLRSDPARRDCTVIDPNEGILTCFIAVNGPEAPIDVMDYIVVGDNTFEATVTGNEGTSIQLAIGVSGQIR